MMIANWIHDSVKPQVVSARISSSLPASSFPDIDNEFAGVIRRVMPRSATGRSRKGMKGGEH
jgi:hypothetical protein